MTQPAKPLHLRIFLSSPGDVTDERGIALQLFDRLQYDALLRGKVTIEAVAWDKPGADAPMIATMTPQEAINQGLPTPSECDIVVVLFWARMGTPLPSDYKKPDGSRYLSGTEWEYEDAVQAALKTGVPKVIVYRRKEKVLLDPTSPEFDSQLEQWQRVDAFFNAFSNPDGSIKQGYNQYTTPADFGDKFENHLKLLIKQILEQQEEAEDKPAPVDTLPLWAGSPFPGLRAFTPADAPIFFGRATETDSLIKRVGESRFVAVVGASGSGKSSLVGAGLLPRLAANAVAGSKDWVPVRFTPGELTSGDPFEALTVALLRELPGSASSRDLTAQLHTQPASFIPMIETSLVGRPAWAEVLLFIDQFEELFSLVKPAFIEPFIDLLVTTAYATRLRTVITLRADFYARCVEYPKLAALLETATYPLAAPEYSALYEMISRPAARAGLEYETGLADRILRDTGTDPGALALMAYALDELYQAGRTDQRLTHAEYDKLHGVQGAIGERAETTFIALDPAAQACLADVFREICEVDERGVAIRRRASLKQTARTEPASRLVDALTKARLLVQSQSEAGQPIVEVAHEALLRSWTRLAKWIEETQDDLRLLRQVRLGAGEWERAGRKDDDLLTGTRLERARQLDANGLAELEQSYISLSSAREARLKAEQQQREQSLQRTRAQIRYGVGIAVVVLALIFAGFALINGRQESENSARLAVEIATSDANVILANRREAEARNVALALSAQEVFANGNPLLALPLALAANTMPNPPAQAQKALAEVAYAPGIRQIFPGSVINNSTVDISPDGVFAIAGTGIADVTLWEIATGEVVRVLNGHTAFVTAVVFSPDGKTALSASGDGTLILWDVVRSSPTFGQMVRTFSGHREGVSSVAFSPGGQTAISGGGDGNLILWDIASGNRIETFTGHTDSVTSVAFDPFSETVLSGSRDQSMILWDADPASPDFGEAIFTFNGHDNAIQSVAFAPMGAVAISGSYDETVILWDVSQLSPTFGEALHTFIGHSEGIMNVNFSPDGQTILSGSRENTFILWDVLSGQILRTFTGHNNWEGSMGYATFSPDGRSILSTSEDASLIMWDLASGLQIRSYSGNDADLSPDGRTAISTALDRTTLELWDITTGETINALMIGHNDWVDAVAVSPSGKTALSADRSGNLIMWDLVETSPTFAEALYTFQGAANVPYEIDYSPDGKSALVGLSDGTMVLWDVYPASATFGQVVRTFSGHTGFVSGVAYSPDGQTALSGSSDGTMILWDIETAEVLHIFRGHPNYVTSVAFSPDGRTALSAAYDKTLILWDVLPSSPTFGQALRTFTGHSSEVESVVFSPDGRTALSASMDKTLILWDVASGQALRSFEGGHSGGISAVDFSDDGQFALSTGLDSRLVLWRVDTLEEMIQWTYENRAIRELTCSERSGYGVEPSCDAEGLFPTRTPYPLPTAIPNSD